VSIVKWQGYKASSPQKRVYYLISQNLTCGVANCAAVLSLSYYCIVASLFNQSLIRVISTVLSSGNLEHMEQRILWCVIPSEK
jgi:hypothetical protein